MSGSPQSTIFDGLPETYDLNEWKMILEKYGYINALYFSSNRQSGYAVFEKYESAVKAVNELNQSNFPTESDNKISFEIISNEEVEDLYKLSNSKYEKISLFKPESGGSLFQVTKTMPPIYWTDNSHQT